MGGSAGKSGAVGCGGVGEASVVAAVIVWKAPRGDGTGALVMVGISVRPAFGRAGVSVGIVTTTRVVATTGVWALTADCGLRTLSAPETAT